MNFIKWSNEVHSRKYLQEVMYFCWLDSSSAWELDMLRHLALRAYMALHGSISVPCSSSECVWSVTRPEYLRTKGFNLVQGK